MVYTLTVHLYANDEPESIERIKAKLIEAARVYRKDKETVDWIVMQDVHDPKAFTIVERFEQESVSSQGDLCAQWTLLIVSQSQKYHLENPYWKTFDPYVVPLLDKPMDLRRHEELDTSKDVEVPI
jgi:quinol monooxygenase YgiN